MLNNAYNLILMMDWVRSLLGISKESAKQLSRMELYFAAGWPVKTIVILMLLSAIWFGYFYLKDGRRPSLWVKIPLLLLRLVALFALIMMLLQPMLRLQHSAAIRPSVILLADNSLSMGYKDPHLSAARLAQETRAIGGNPYGMTRAQIVSQIFNNPRTNLISELSKRYNVRLYTFCSDSHAVPLPVQPAKLASWKFQDIPDPIQGHSTQIGTALRKVLDDVSGQPVAGALILSDGGNNLGDDPVNLASSGRTQGVRISALGIGDPTPTKNLAITEVLADQVVRKNGQVQVYVGVSQRGYDGKTISLTLIRNGSMVATKSLRLGASSQKQTVTFTYVPKQDGVFTYTVSTPVLPGEVTTQSNKRSYIQKVTSKKLKILYVEGTPRWEYRYLKNAVLRDKQIEFSCLLTAGNPAPGGEGDVPIDGFPTDEQSLFKYDILIIGDVPRSYFSDLQLENIRHFVEDKGGSLIIICGQQHMPWEYLNTPLNAIFPVVVPSTPEQVITNDPFQWELTSQGWADPMLRMSNNPGENAQIWRTMPGMYWCAGVTKAKPGATVLAVNSRRSNAYGKRILLAVQNFGAGRCLLTTTDGCWHWRWKVGDRYFYRYWGQAIRAMTPEETPGGNRFAQVNTDRSEYLLGDRVSVHARLLDAFYRPVKDRTATVTIKSDTGVTSSIVLTSSPASPGLFSGDFLADRIGKFQLSVASPANPSAKATCQYLVQSIALERQQPEMNEALLKKIAAAGGGMYLHPDEINKWISSLTLRAPVVKSESEIDLWDAPILLILFIVPLGVEWFVRKKSGML